MYTLPSPFHLIQEAWQFYRKHSVFNAVVFWLLALPFWILNLLQSIAFSATEPASAPYPPLLLLEDPVAVLLLGLAGLLLTLITIWGTATVLFVGKRILTSRAGRTRTSFKAVRSEGLYLILPLFFTMILRLCFILLWSVLPLSIYIAIFLLGPRDAPTPASFVWLSCFFLLILLLPAIIYTIRTALYQAVIVCDDLFYRSALKESKTLTKGHFWGVAGSLLIFVIVLFVPALLLDLLFTIASERIDGRLMFIGDVIGSIVFAYATMLMLLSIIALYSALKKLPDPIP